MAEFTREQLISLCERGRVPQDKWVNRDSANAQQQLGEALALLHAGCEFMVIENGSLKTTEKAIWVEITFHGFSYFEYGEGSEERDTFYIPTDLRLEQCEGEDWYF